VAKYDHLTEFLNANRGELNISMDLSMDELAAAVPGGLPPSAYKFEAWWSNDDATHRHSHSWADAGYDAHPDLRAGTVRFTPRRGERRRK